MRSLERVKGRESLDASLARIAYAYGFTAPPIAIPKSALKKSDVSEETCASVAILKAAGKGKGSRQLWASVKGPKHTSVLTFAILSERSAIAHALVVKTVLAIADETGCGELSVSVSSVGDLESKRRFTRELGNFFKKNHDELPPDVRHIAAHDPDQAYRLLMKSGSPLSERAPRTIDYLSENSRKIMLDTLSLFESVGIAYVIDPRLMSEDGLHAELLFAVTGTIKGERSTIAIGGRFDELMKREGITHDPTVSMSMKLPMRARAEEMRDPPQCFVVHVGEAAKLKMFGVLEAVSRSQIAVGQAIMENTLREQMERALTARTKYIAIVGQREALDNTVIVRNAATQLQQTIPMDKLVGYLGRYAR